jgi:hydroxyacylglutathione hydrolase
MNTSRVFRAIGIGAGVNRRSARMARIIKISLGTSNAYLVGEHHRYILVDAGNAGRVGKVKRVLRTKGILPSQVELIVITHVHYDHVGSLKAIQDLCGCPVAVHEKEAPLLRSGRVVFPRGTNLLGKCVMGLGTRLSTIRPALFAFEPVEPGIVISEEMSLERFGIAGTMVPTPGHSSGSLSVVLSDGTACVGDLAINYLPFGLGPIFPPFADDVHQLLLSWDLLLEKGVHTIFPGHGNAFPASKLGRKKADLLPKLGRSSD